MGARSDSPLLRRARTDRWDEPAATTRREGVTDPPPMAEAIGTRTCSAAQVARAKGRSAGLVPRETTTGGPKQQRLGAITKHGNAQARCMLVQAAWHILRVGPKNDPLHRWGMNIAAKRGKKIASVALARRLAGVLWAMWRDGRVYDPLAVGQASAKGFERAAQDLETVAVAMKKAVKKITERERQAKRLRDRPRRTAMAKQA